MWGWLLLLLLIAEEASDTRAALGAGAGAGAECPCSSPELCQPLSQQSLDLNEGLSIVFTNDQKSDVVGKHWDFSKIAMWAPFTHLGPQYSIQQQLYCTAHEKNIPVYTWGYESYDGGSCPITQFYSWALSGSDKVYDKAAVDAWAADAAACTIEKGFDGILLDMEGVGGPPLGPEEMLDAIYYAVCSLKHELNSHLPYAKIIWTADTGPYFPYDNLTADGCVDLWIDMAYDWCVAEELNIDFRNRANSPLPYIDGDPQSIVQMYTRSYNVPLDKLAIAFPWYGCQFNCTRMEDPSNNAYEGCESPVLLPTQPSLDTVLDEWIPIATSDVIVNDTVTCKYVNANYEGSPGQTWFDDESTLSPKYKYAFESGVQYVGVWTVDMIDAHPEDAEKMWQALPSIR